MRILVASAFRPAWEPAGPDLAPALERALARAGHDVESIRIPFEPDPDGAAPQLLALRLTDVRDTGHLLIATAAPCHLIRHARKVLWLSEHYPWPDELGEPPEWMRQSDRQAVDEAQAAYAVSLDLCARIRFLTGRAIAPLPAPAAEDESWNDVLSVLTAPDPEARSR